VGNTAYFAYQHGSVPYVSGLWRSDGTTSGTKPVLYSDGSSIGPSFLTPFGTKLIFWGEDIYDGSERNTGGLSITDGTNAGTHALGVYPLPYDYFNDAFEPTPRTVLNSVLYFPAQTYDLNGNFSDFALWRTDGTAVGTYPVTAEYPKGAPTGVVAAGGKVFFSAKAGKGTELYAYVP
jgi:hypothetical protein